MRHFPIGIDGIACKATPNLIVNGKYLISTGQAVTTQQEMLNVVDFLIEMERQALATGG